MLPMLSLGVMVTRGFTAWFSGSISPWWSLILRYSQGLYCSEKDKWWWHQTSKRHVVHKTRGKNVMRCVTCLTGHWQSQPPRPGRGCPGTRRPTPSPRLRTASRWWWGRTRRTRPARTQSPSQRRYQPHGAPGRHWNDNDSQKSCENWLLICNPY